MKKFILFLLVLFLACEPVTFAATQKTEKTATEAEKADVKNGKAPKHSSETSKNENNFYKCAYYSVNLPADWRAVLPPEEREGLVNAIFARNTNSTVISLIIGPRGGADAKLIASMFAEQFKATKAPVEKNGQYFFSFNQKDALEQKTFVSTSCVSVSGDEFMITTWSGNQKEAQKFLKDNIRSEHYSQLLPQ